MEVKIERLSDTGEGIGIINNKVIFVPKSIPNDIVLVKDIVEYKKYMVGHIEKMIIKSSDRCSVRCPYFDMCGGCQIMNMCYDKQLLYKKNKVINMFKKYANININPVIVGTDIFNYRNKIILEVKDGKLGLFKYRSHDVINISECLLVNDIINEVIEFINNNIDLSLVKKVMIKISTDRMVMVNFSGSISSDDIDKLKNVVYSIYVNDKCVWGNDKIVAKLNNYSFEVSANSFFQVNYDQMIRLYDKVIDYLPSFGNVMDLYCGTGSIGIYVSFKCKKILGIEINENAVRDANRNKVINKIDNIDFICGDVEDIISDNDYFDSIIVDPPRAGLSNKTKDMLLKIGSKNIIYVSCDPMTLVRDIKYLSDKYSVKDITLFDMFPNTYHVESVCFLERK